MATQTISFHTPKRVEDCSTPAKPSHSNPNSISKVRVIVRVRPFLPHEIASKNGNPVACVSVLDPELETSEEVTVHLKDQETSRNECYKLDSFFGQEDNNVFQIFNKEVSPLIPGIFRGCNATVFAYGATGSGKTYTMQGSVENPGIMPLAMSKILSMCQRTGSSAEISYYEVYMDRCYDLLELKGKEIAVLDDKDGQIHLKGLSRIPVNSMSEFNEIFSCGIQRRKVAHTGLNDVSSRSHGVLVVTISSPCGDSSAVSGKLNLIDLAGNEDNRRTCNEGIRLQESAKINQSLFALSNVIYALNNNKPRVPYRESKLTRILQDSLGGTSQSLMVACLNPGEYQESVHTVSLAARSRHISNFVSSAQKNDTPKVKVDMEAKLRAWLESKGKSTSVQRIGAFGSPFLSQTPNSLSSARKPIAYLSSARKPIACPSSTKEKTSINQCGSNAKERTLFMSRKNLFNNGGPAVLGMENPELIAERNTEEEIKGYTDGIMLESERYIPDGSLDKEEKTTSIESSPICDKMKALQSSLRKVLSPINSNVNMETISSRDETIGTPLDKFNALSSHVKSSLVREYIDFLNTASREELLELKGIGEKMAEYILELRELSPVKRLSDLEKIGLSSKQVHNMFGRTAKRIFD